MATSASGQRTHRFLRCCSSVPTSGDDRIRTDDPLNANQVLCQAELRPRGLDDSTPHPTNSDRTRKQVDLSTFRVDSGNGMLTLPLGPWLSLVRAHP